MKKTRIFVVVFMILLSLTFVGFALAADSNKESNPPNTNAVTPDMYWPGPDGFGYLGSVVNFNWVDITSSGTLIEGLGDDNSAGPFPLGFAFNFYGTPWTDFFANSNGFLSFGAGSTAYSNQCPLPDPTAPDNLIAMVWDDMNFNLGGSAYYQTFDPCPTGDGACTVIEYFDVPYYTQEFGSAGTWETVLYEDGSFLIQFLDAGTQEGNSSTSGIEGANFPSDFGLTYACNAPTSISDNLALLFEAVATPNLSESNKSAPTYVEIGQTVNYTIDIINSGTGPANNASVVDPIPAGTSYNGDVDCSSGECWFDGANVLWNGVVEDDSVPVVVTFSVAPNGLSCGDLIQNTAAISDAALPSPVNVTASTQLINTTFYFEDFEASDGGFVNSGPYPWTWGPAPEGLAPAHSGVNVWATESPYQPSADYRLDSPAIDLTGVNPGWNLVLSWWQRLDVEVGYDYAYVSISTDGVNWQTLWTGNYHGDWQNITADITPYVGQIIYLRFEMTSDSSVQYNGWAIDDVSIFNGCTNLMVPDIEVTPSSIEKVQGPDVVESVPLSIGNVGIAPLNWTIDESPTAGMIPNKPTKTDGSTLNSVSNDSNYKVPVVNEIMKRVSPNLLALINDGSFENGPPPASAWTEVSDQPCEWIGDFSGGWGVPAFDGTFDYWAGGYCGGIPTTSNVSQVVSVPASGGTISFWYITYRPNVDDPDLDYAYVSIAGNTVWTYDLIQANDTYPAWVNATVDVSQWAGQDVTLMFGAVSTGITTGNIRFDFIELQAAPACSNPSDVPWLSEVPSEGVTEPGEVSTSDIYFDSTGLAPGAYTADLCVNSDDPEQPVVQVPVSLTVLTPGPHIQVTPPALFASQESNQITHQNLNIGNYGTEDLVWSLWEGAPVTGWSENFDEYETGQDLFGLNGWKGWGNNPSATAYTSDAFVYSPANSVEIGGASDLVHEYGYNTGLWTYTGWMYVPTDFTGQSYFILLNQYDDAGNNLNWSLEVQFDSVSATVKNDGPAGGTLPLVTGQWVAFQDVIDLDNDTQTFIYNGNVLFTDSWKDGMSGGGIDNIQAVDFYANMATPIYYDDLALTPVPSAFCGGPGQVPWLCVSPVNGTTLPGESTIVDVQFDSTGLAPGTYTGSLFAASNDVDNPSVEIPVTFEVTGPSVVRKLYLTSLDIGTAVFAAYDLATDTWTPLTDYETGCQMAVSTSGNLYAYGYNTATIDLYDPNTDTWTPVLPAPPGSTGSYCNLEITNTGEFLYTEVSGTSLWYTTGGTWNSIILPFTTDAMGDYDPTTDQYVIGEYATTNAHMINVHDFTITDYLSALPGGEYGRFSVVMGDRYYFQLGDLDMFDFDLTAPGNPPTDHFIAPGFFSSAAGDRLNNKIYSASIDGFLLNLIDPVANTMTPLTGYTVYLWHSSVALVTSVEGAPGPDISVNPESLVSTIFPNTQETQGLNICNIGTEPLNWSLTEVPGLKVKSVTVTPVKQASHPVALSLEADGISGPTAPAPAVPNADVSLVLDDGSRDNDIGIGGGTELLWVNRFTPDPADFPFKINQVQIYFSSLGLVEVGDPIKLVFYENTSGNDDPAVGSTFLAVFDTAVQALDTWNVYDLPSDVIFNGPTGDAVIGAIAMKVPFSSYWPASIDQTTTQARSWAGWWNTSPPPNPPLLPPDADWTLIDAYFPGNWMVRAYGQTLVAGIPWLSEDPTSGSVTPGTCQNVLVTFDSTGLGVGTYNGSLDITNNDPDTPVVNVPVTLNVVKPEMIVTAPPLEMTLFPGQSDLLSFTIANGGTADLVWSLTDDAAWLSEFPEDGVIVPGGDAQAVDVTFDSADLQPGVYEGNITITSNDPDNPVVVLPATLTVVPYVADLAVTKTASAAQVRVGDTITYTLVVDNEGPDQAFNAVLVDTLPAGTTFKSAAGCTHAAGIVTCNLGDIAAEGTKTRTIVVTATADGVAHNVAEVTSDSDDPNEANNTSSVDVTITPAIYFFYLPIVQKG